MDRIHLMELVRAKQVGAVTRREFLTKATATLGSLALANSLLVACSSSTSEETPPPVVDTTQPTATVGTTTTASPTSPAQVMTTGIVTYAGKDETELMGYIAYQENQDPRPAVIVLQEWWGLNDHIKDVAQRFAQEGYVVLAPDLYHGVVTTEPDEARKLAMELGMRDAVGEIQQAMAYLRAQPFTTDKVGMVGFCMGGGLVLQTAANDTSLNAGIAFYGSPLNPVQAKEVQAPILSFIGTEDNTPVIRVETMHNALTDNNIENHFEVYEGAQHAFFNDTRASYDAEAAADAWQQTLQWFATYL